MRLEIEEVESMESVWQDYWPLHDALQEYHAGLGNGRRRPNAEAGSRTRLVKLFASRPSKVLMARSGKSPVGMATARLVEGGWTGQEPVGHLSDFYIRPEARGSSLLFQFLNRLEEWIGRSGRHFSEHGTLLANARTVRLSLHKGYRPYVESFRRRILPLPAVSNVAAGATGESEYQLRRVTDLKQDWAKIWPLLRQLDRHRLAIEPCNLAPDREDFRRQEFESALTKRSRLLIAERNGRPVAVAGVRIVQDPSITVETVGLVNCSFFQEAASACEWPDTPLSRTLHAELERWLRTKGVQVIQADVLASDESARQVLIEAGYTPHKFELHKALTV